MKKEVEKPSKKELDKPAKKQIDKPEKHDSHPGHIPKSQEHDKPDHRRAD